MHKKIISSKKSTKLYVIFFTIFALISITIIKFQFNNGSKPQSIRIAWIGPLTGNAKILGEDNFLAIEMAIDQYNTNKHKDSPLVELNKYDDQYLVENTKNIYDQIKLTFKPHIIFLNTYEAMFELNDTLLRNHVIVINPIDNDQKLASLNNNIFLIAKRTEQLASIITHAMMKDSIKNAAVVYFKSDSFMPTVADEVRESFSGGNKIASLYPYKINETDFEKILSINEINKLDAIILLGYSEIEYAVRYIRSINKNIKLYSINTALALAKKHDVSKLIEGMRVAHFTKFDGNISLANTFLHSFKSEYKRSPNVDWIAFQAFDSANIILDSIKRLEKKNPRDKIFKRLKENMYSGKLYKGISGDITINADGSSDGIFVGSYIISKGKVIKNDLN